MATMETISEALKLIPQKKSLLRQAFEDLQFHSSSFSLSWSDLDSHFSALQATAEAKVKLLQSQPPDQTPKPQPQPQIEPPPLDKVEERKEVKARPEVKAFCEKMDGLGLRTYIGCHRSRERYVIGDELPDAFKYASDAAAMVLDALECFLVPNLNGEKDLQLVKIREACIVMFKGLMDSKVEILPEVRERAKNLALDWKEKVRLNDSNVLEPYGFLYLVAIYGLVDVFSINDLFDMAVIVATRFVVAAPLIRVLPFGDKVSDLIQKIISKGKQLQAVRYVLEFELAGRFPPVTLLQDFVNEAKKNTLKTQKDGNRTLQSLNDSSYKETSALKTVLNLIEDHKIEAEFLKQRIFRRIEVLEKQKANRKKRKHVPSLPQNLSGVKRPRVTPLAEIPNSVAFANSANIPPNPTFCTTQSNIYNASSTVQAYQQSNPQFLPTPVASTTSSTVPPYQQSFVQHNVPIAGEAVPTYQQSNLQFLPSDMQPNVASTTGSTVSPYQQSFVQHNVPISGEAVPSYQQSYLQPARSLPNTHTQYSNSKVAAYSSAGATSVTPYANSSDGTLYGSANSLPNTHTQYSSSQVAAYGSEGDTSVNPYANSSDGTLYGSASSLPNTHTQHPSSQVAVYGSAGATSVNPYANSSDSTLYGSASSLPNTNTQYSGSQVVAYGLADATSVTPYANSSAEALYGSAEASLPHVPAHQPDPNVSSGDYAGYAMAPQYHPSYQPQ